MMEKNEGDSKTNNLEDFNLKNELSALVAKNVIPKRIADRLELKLKEKQVKINAEQLCKLVDKIKNEINNYSRYEQKTKNKETCVTQQSMEKITDINMQKLVETIEKLQDRITNMESGIVNKDIIKYSSEKKEKILPPKIVTTDDIKITEGLTRPVQEWKFDPLTEIPNDPESIIVLMKWLQYLIDKCGRPNLSNILDYYVDIGWLSEDAKICLIEYSHGITEESKTGEPIIKNISHLPSKDHIQSFIFIQKLRGRQFDKHFIDRIDGELARITKKFDSYQIK